MKKLLLTATALVALALPAMSTQAMADIVQATPFFIDLGAEGFGDAHRLLTLQQTPQEAGGTVAGVNGATFLTGQAISGADKSAIAGVTALGWSTGANVGLGLNIDVTGNTTGMAVNSAVLTIFNAAGSFVQSFSLAAPFTLTSTQVDEQRGNGQGVFNFVLDQNEQNTWNNIIAANGGTNGLFVGFNSNMGCASGALSCLTDDGPDSWLAFNQSNPTATPLPASLLLFASALGIGGLLLRRRRSGVSVW